MRKYVFALGLSACCGFVQAGSMGEAEVINPYFAKIGGGYSWSLQANVSPNNPPSAPFWDPADQGYNSDLGHSTFYFFEAGRTLTPYLDISASYVNHDEFNYQKYQSSPTPVPLPQGYTGNSRTRFFQLDNQALLINANLHPTPMMNFVGFAFTPYVEGGIGLGHNRVRDFHTVGEVNPPGVGSVSSIGNDIFTNSFAWQGSLGINLNPEDSRLSMDLGYRYFYGGKFEGPSTVLSNSASNPGQFVTGTAWTGKLKAHEAYVGFKFKS